MANIGDRRLGAEQSLERVFLSRHAFAADETGQFRKRIASFGALRRGRRGGAQATFELVQIDLRTKLGGKLTHGQPSRFTQSDRRERPSPEGLTRKLSASLPAL